MPLRTNNDQLDFFKDLTSTQAKDERIVELLLEEIKCMKYLRANIRLSLSISKEEITKLLTPVELILFALAMTCFRKSRYTGKFRYKDTDYFVQCTKDHKELGMDFPADKARIQELVDNIGGRLRGIFYGQADAFKAIKSTVDVITQNFKTLNYLLKWMNTGI